MAPRPESRTIRLNLTWHSEDQRAIFISGKRFLSVRAGRRWGKTKGAMHRMVELLFQERPSRHLWIDTTQRNIDLYFDEHLRPVLPDETYKFDLKKKVLTTINGSVVHFGSAERPENLEGFGYDYLWANEAGFIFRGPAGERLWVNTLRPMVSFDSPGGALCRFIGTPKGPGLFEEFCRRGSSADPQWAEWEEVQRASFDRPGISQAEIDTLVLEYPGGRSSAAFRQEILAEFIGGQDEEAFIPYDMAREALERSTRADPSFEIVWGCDPAGHGDDVAAVAKRRGLSLLEPVTINDGDLDGYSGARWLMFLWEQTKVEDRPKSIVVDASSWGEGWYTHGREMGLPVVPVNWATKSSQPTRFYRLRDELWWRAREWLAKGSLGADTLLMQELVRPNLDMNWQAKNLIKVESKPDMLKRFALRGQRKHGFSPNRADAFVLSFALGDPKKPQKDDEDEGHAYQHVTWMGAW